MHGQTFRKETVRILISAMMISKIFKLLNLPFDFRAESFTLPAAQASIAIRYMYIFSVISYIIENFL